MALYEGNVSWTKREDGAFALIARSAGRWNANNVVEMLATIAKEMPKGAAIFAYSVWIDMGLAEAKGKDGKPANISLTHLLALAKTADRVELIAVRPKGKPYLLPKLKLTKGSNKANKADSKEYF
jgi:hypothetical protein